MKDILNLYDPQTVISFIFFLAFVGFGFWFYKSGWPFLKTYFERKQEFNQELEKLRLETEAESDRRWQETTATQTKVFADFREELGLFRGQMSAMNSNIERLFRYLVKVNGHENDFDS